MPSGALSSGNGFGGSGPTGLLSGGGVSQAMLQLILSGMTRGSGLMPRLTLGRSIVPDSPAMPQGEMQPAPDMAEFSNWLRVNGLDSGWGTAPMGLGQPPPMSQGWPG